MERFSSSLPSAFKGQFNRSLLWLLPYLIFTLALIIAPLVLLIWQGLASSLDEQTALIRTKTIQAVLIRSILIGLTTAATSVLITLVVTYILLQIDSKLLRSLVVSLLTSPLLVFTIVKI